MNADPRTPLDHIDDRTRAARMLLSAAQSGPIPPLSATYPDFDLDDAYAVQRITVEHWLGHGRRVSGHKVGLTSLAVQQQLGVTQPDFGHLFDDSFFETGDDLPEGKLWQPRAEPEIAFVLGRDLVGPGITTAQVARSVDHVVAALEIVDSRIRDWEITLVDTVADNASCGGVVLGTRPTLLDASDLRLTGTVLYRNGEITHSGAGAAVMGSPLSAVAWLANTLGTRGVTLTAGSVILPGAMTPMVQLKPGDVVTASFGGLGTVSTRLPSDPDQGNAS
ncbi:2-keto-4-pentenoate hydratase [Sphingomonas sp. BLCC-B65]|nr:2-keto-4-pentenoate hydratase [Sphingomonas sp. BLCC-B65]